MQCIVQFVSAERCFSLRKTASGGREYLGFCEHDETKDLVTRDHKEAKSRQTALPAGNL